MWTENPRPPRRRSAPRPGARRRWWRRHLITTTVLSLFLVIVVIAAPSLITALTRPGTDSVAARLAEWGRSHGLSSAIDGAERIQYDLNPPKVGGVPPGGLPTEPVTPRPVRSSALPGPVRPLVSHPLVGEGLWHVTATVSGQPATAVAYMRADPTHTSYVSGLVWMNPKILRFSLHPGTLDPGRGNWGQPNTIPAQNRLGVLAAFNSGFRLYASHGGYLAYGHQARALRAGAASFVIHRDGSATVGQWGRDVHLTSDVVAVRQNLDLIVDGGRPAAGLSNNTRKRWGATLGNAYYVWRSGVGVRRDGSLVYAAGNTLSAQTLAGLLARAGCTRAMELDINPEWTSLVLFSGNGRTATPTPHNLLPTMQQPADRYFSPVSRDFFVVDARVPGSNR